MTMTISISFFSHGQQPKAGREIQAELNRIMNNEGPLAKNQPEASVRAVSKL